MNDIFNDILAYIPNFNLKEQKGLIINVAVFIFLSFIVFYTTSHLLISYAEVKETEEKMATMERYVLDYRQKVDKIREFPFRPIDANKIDETQTKIIFSVQALKLQLDSLKELPNKKEQHGRAFEIEFAGPYKETLDCLQSFGSKDALIGLKKLNMQSKEGKIHTKLVYKIYTK